MQLGNEKEKKNQCRLRVSYNVHSAECVCVEMTDPYPVSGACSSRLMLFLIPGAAPVIKSREAAPAAAAIIKPFSVFISSNITLTLFLSLSFSGALCSVKRRAIGALLSALLRLLHSRAAFCIVLREDIVYHRSHLAFQRGRPACEIPATMTKIPHGVHSKLKIVIHAVTTTPR